MRAEIKLERSWRGIWKGAKKELEGAIDLLVLNIATEICGDLIT